MQEPAVDLGQFVYLIDRISGAECFGDDEDAGISRFVQRLVDVGNHQLLVLYEAVHALPDHTQALLDGFFESTSDSHYFADGFHTRSQLAGHTVELAQVPTRDLADHIVESRLKESARRLRHRVLQVEEAVTQTQLSCHESQRIAGCLRCQRRRTGKAGVHLDHPVVLAFGVESVLYVTFAHNTDMADDPDSQFTQFMIFTVGQRLRRSDHDALTGMDA